MIKDLLPEILKKDEKFLTIAEAIGSQIVKINSEIVNALIYPRIDELSGEILDLLAWQFHVDFWRADLSVESKRELVKNSIEWHRHKGTVWAVKNVLKAVGVKAEVVEWFDDEGLNVYEFGVRCWIERPLSNSELYSSKTSDDIKELIEIAKNVRSKLAWYSIAVILQLPFDVKPDRFSLVENKHNIDFSLYPLFDLYPCDDLSLDASFVSTKIITSTSSVLGLNIEGQGGLDALPNFDDLPCDFAPLDTFMEV